ncbi:MAG: NADH-quinone oxidoreductase subunit NuoE [bacterium]
MKKKDNCQEYVEALIRNNGSSDALITILQDVQSEYKYLPKDALREVAAGLNLPLIQVFGVASFFRAFSLTPRGRHCVKVCLGTACHVRGASAVLEELERELGIKNGQTTEDMHFTLETVNCLGACALGPVVVVDETYYGQMNPGKVKKMLDNYKKTVEANR